MAKFDDDQLGQLKELFAKQEERLFGKVTEEGNRLAGQFTQILDQRFVEERTYFKQLLQQELGDIQTQLARIEARIGGDAKDALTEIDQLRRRVDELEATVSKLQTA